ncbi:MAG: EVE domain-containing protein, partial [Aggregatilineales bacterium]
KYWITVAAKDHVMIGVNGNFCQLGHGKKAPVARLKPADWLTYYAPRTKLKGGDRVQAFVALGQIKPGEPYKVKVSDEFLAWRRDVDYSKGEDAAIHPLLDKLSFIDDKRYWGIKFRRSLFEVNHDDFMIIASAMSLQLQTSKSPD